MNWIKVLEGSENINKLPLYSELEKIANSEDVNLYEEWNGKRTIADGTVIELETLEHKCFADSRNEWTFYHVANSDIYICAECGLWQKSYSDLKNEIEYIEDSEELLLPYDWNINGVKAYLNKRMVKQKERESNYIIYEREKTGYGECWNCIHMKKSECEYNNDEDECEDFESYR